MVVTFEGYLAPQRYAEETSLTWPLLIDQSRELYRSYGMLLASFWDVWGPKTWWVYLKEIIKGKRPKKPGADIRQRGGDILIDPDGIVQLHHVGAGPADRPSVKMIMQIIAEWRPEEKPPNNNVGDI